MTSPPDFDETFYLAANPDVKSAVEAGAFTSGWDHYRKHGRQEGRICAPGTPDTGARVLSREAKLLGYIETGGIGLEIGPSHRPIAARRSGYNVDIVDHLDSAGLRSKYAGHGVDTDSIEDVDFVSTGQPLSELIGRANYYDWIIASHVIEHIPDVISWLQQCEILLKPGGRLALIVPDKRFCFDHLQPTSSTGSMLDALHEGRIRPSPGQVFDHHANACKRNGALSWDSTLNGPVSLVHSANEARQAWETVATSDTYLDVHCWRFTPTSFRMILSDLALLGLISLGVIQEFDTVGNEFHFILEKGTKPTAKLDRLSELTTILEQR
jgi:SAM-dependent methyltransferase